MKGRTVIIWLCFLIVAGAALVISQQADQRAEAEKALSEMLFALPGPADVQNVRLQGKAYPRPVELRRDETGWVISQPIQGPADQLAVQRMLRALLGLRIMGRNKPPASLKPFGLDHPEVDLTLVDRKDADHRLLIGSTSPTDVYVYAMPADKSEVWLAPIALCSPPARQSLYELRSKNVLAMDPQRVIRVQINRAGDNPLREDLHYGDKAGEGAADATKSWRLADGRRADPEAVQTFLGDIANMRAAAFLDSPPEGLATGLDKPLLVIDMTYRDGEHVGLSVGAADDQDRGRYVLRLSGGPLMVVADSYLGSLMDATSFSLMDRRLVHMAPENAVRLVCRGPDGRREFAKDAQGKWYGGDIANPLRAQVLAEKAVLALANLRWEKELPAGDYGLDPPRITLTVVCQPPDGGDGQVSHVLELGDRIPGQELMAAKLGGDKRIFGIDLWFEQFLPVQQGGKETPAKP